MRTALCILCLSATSVFAQQTLLVPSQYATIQAAINAAANGDTVLVGNSGVKGTHIPV